MPGVPDIYQGTELWADSLVDPDNRRPVDFVDRTRLLESVGNTLPAVDETGAAKLWITQQALRLRRNKPDSFGGYRPIAATGPAHHHLIGFDRGGVITLATRLPVGLATAGGWRDSTVKITAPHVDVLTDRRWTGTVAIEDLLASFPVALLLEDERDQQVHAVGDYVAVLDVD
jgi:(1->4)-alpha-D-glucan 1-alpha-D-glucosylmutase